MSRHAAQQSNGAMSADESMLCKLSHWPLTLLLGDAEPSLLAEALFFEGGVVPSGVPTAAAGGPGDPGEPSSRASLGQDAFTAAEALTLLLS